MPDSKAKSAWDRANTSTITLKLNRRTDAAILAKLATVDSKQGYIKALIIADIKSK